MLVTIQRWGFIVETGLAVLDGDNACLKEETHNCHASSFFMWNGKYQFDTA